MKLPQTGGCHCGALRYEITEAPALVYTCHCTDCQRLTGSAFSMAFLAAAETFFLTGAAPRPFRHRADSGHTVARWTCPACGTWVSSGPEPASARQGELICVRAGTLDDTSWLHPTMHFWTRSAQPWVKLPEGGRRFETQPDHSG
jgi:hypothetical protein